MQCIERVENLLKFVLAKGVGCITINRLLRRFGSSDAILGASEADIAAVEGINKNHVKAVLAARNVHVQMELDTAYEAGVQIIPYDDPAFPQMLLQIPDPPFLLYVKGNLKHADNCGVGIVGTRFATDYGLHQAELFGGALARAGYTVFSGLARGIDTFAHRGALMSNGRTVGIVGNGLSHVYPPENRDLYIELSHTGAIISEMPMEMEPSRDSFPRRNRIIAGMSLGVLVVEAPLKSGALITARQALDYGREVFAIPGQIDHENAQGCNKLIRDGAALIGCPGDILDELHNCCSYADLPGPRTAPGKAVQTPPVHASATTHKAQPSPSKQSPENTSDCPTDTDAPIDKNKLRAPQNQQDEMAQRETAILAQLNDKPKHIDFICDAVNFPIGDISSTLMILELKGLVKQHPGKLFTTR